MAIAEVVLYDVPPADSRSETGTLMLRPLNDDDIADIVVTSQDPLTQAYTTVPFPYTEQDARCFLEDHSAVRWALCLPDQGGRYLGTIELREVNQAASFYDVGYVSAPSARGKGLMTRALKRVIAHAIDSGAHRIEVRVRTTNQASRKVAEAAGCQLEEIARGWEFHRGQYHDLAIYSFLSGDVR